MKKSIPKIREREGNEKNPFPQFGNGNQRLSFPRIPGNGNGNGKFHSESSGTGRKLKKSIPINQEWESEAIIPKNFRERE